MVFIIECFARKLPSSCPIICLKIKRLVLFLSCEGLSASCLELAKISLPGAASEPVSQGAKKAKCYLLARSDISIFNLVSAAQRC